MKIQLKDWYRIEIKSKAFAIPILTASGLYVLDNIAVRIGIANALGFTSIQ